MSSRARSLAFAVAFLVAGLGASALFWGTDRAHFRLFALAFHEYTVFGVEGGRALSSEEVGAVDDGTRAYVLCECDDGALLERIAGFYDEREKAHLRDVQAVLAGTKRVTLVAALLALVLGAGLGRDAFRRAVLTDAALVVGVGALAALLFEPAFLLFHRIFFPQGNFLFDPATDDLVRLYPEGYWLLVTVLLGLTFVALCLVVAALRAVPIGFAAGPRSEGKPVQ